MPIAVAGEFRFGLSLATVGREVKWGEHVIQRSRILGEILANALLRSRMDRELQNQAEALRTLNTELSRTEDRARRKLAAVLHDDLAQNLFGTSAELIAIRNACPDALQIALDRVLAKLDDALKQARDLTYDLCPPVLYELGLVPALAKLAERFSRQHDIAFSVAHDAADVNIDSDLASLLYQAVRELFLNVAKHSRARHAVVAVDQTDAGLVISVTDDGVGCPDAEGKITPSGSGFGLFNIRERLRSLDGQLTVGNAPEGGCVVRLSVPIHIVTIQGR
jgi:signal transduction histidine kinase